MEISTSSSSWTITAPEDIPVYRPGSVSFIDITFFIDFRSFKIFNTFIIVFAKFGRYPWRWPSFCQISSFDGRCGFWCNTSGFAKWTFYSYCGRCCWWSNLCCFCLFSSVSNLPIFLYFYFVIIDIFFDRLKK